MYFLLYRLFEQVRIRRKNERKNQEKSIRKLDYYLYFVINIGKKHQGKTDLINA